MDEQKQRPIMVIHKDGRKGFLTTEQETGKTIVEYDDGTTGGIEDTSELYRIGSTVYGNKVDESEIVAKITKLEKRLNHDLERIKMMKHQFNLDKAQYDHLRKQLFRLQNTMRPDWKEHMEGRRTEEQSES